MRATHIPPAPSKAADAPASGRRNLAILAFTLMVVMLGFGIVIPIITFYMERLGAGGTELGLLVASYAMMRLICGPVWGSLSDRVGRKPILMIGVFGYGITMGLSNSFMSLGRIAGPALGGVAFDINTEYPYIAGAAITRSASRPA